MSCWLCTASGNTSSRTHVQFTVCCAVWGVLGSLLLEAHVRLHVSFYDSAIAAVSGTARRTISTRRETKAMIRMYLQLWYGCTCGMGGEERRTFCAPRAIPQPSRTTAQKIVCYTSATQTRPRHGRAPPQRILSTEGSWRNSAVVMLTRDGTGAARSPMSPTGPRERPAPPSPTLDMATLRQHLGKRQPTHHPPPLT